MDGPQDEVDGQDHDSSVSEDRNCQSSVSKEATDATLAESKTDGNLDRSSKRNIFEAFKCIEKDEKIDGVNDEEHTADMESNEVRKDETHILGNSPKTSEETVRDIQNQEGQPLDSAFDRDTEEKEAENSLSSEKAIGIQNSTSSDKVTEEHVDTLKDSDSEINPPDQDMDPALSAGDRTLCQGSKQDAEEDAKKEKNDDESSSDLGLNFPETDESSTNMPVNASERDEVGESDEKLVTSEEKSVEMVKHNCEERVLLSENNIDDENKGVQEKQINNEEKENTHSAEEKEKMLDQTQQEEEQKVEKPENQNTNLELEGEDSQGLVIDIEENDESEAPRTENNESEAPRTENNESEAPRTENNEPTQKERNASAEENNANKGTIEMAGKLDENNKVISVDEIEEKQEVDEKGKDEEVDHKDKNEEVDYKDKNDSTDTQKESTDDVEEIQTLLQEFVNSSSKSKVLPDSAKISMEQTDTLSDSSQKRTTEDAWSTVGLVRCPHCLFTTDQKDLLDTHMSSCNKQKTKREEIHLMYSTDGKYGCKNCLFVSPQRKKFEEHVAFHILADPYICLSCMTTYDSKRDIEKHVKKSHSNKMVKCGLRGSKKINKIIEELYTKKEITFLGRQLNKKMLLSMIDQKEESSQISVNKKSIAVSQLPKTIEELENKITKERSNPTTILSVPNVLKVNQLPSITSRKPVLSANTTTSAISKPKAVSMTSASFPVNVSSVPQAVIAQPMPAVGGPVLCNVVRSQPQPVIFVPVNSVQVPIHRQLQPGTVMTGPYSLQSGKGQIGSRLIPVSRSQVGQFVNISPVPPSANAVISNNQTQRLIVVPSTKPPAESVQQANSFVQYNHGQKSLPTKFDIPSCDSNSNKKQLDSTSAGFNDDSASLKLSIKVDGNLNKPENQLLFKKSGNMCSCKTCDFKSDLEENFLRHIWIHIHPTMCKLREHLEYKPTISCKLVSKIMDGLKCAAAAAEAQRKLSSDAKKIIQAPEQIVLSSDEEEDSHAKELLPFAEPTSSIDNADLNNGENDLQIRITSTFSLSEPASNSSDIENEDADNIDQTMKHADDGNKISEITSEKEMFRDLSPDRESSDEVGAIKDYEVEKTKTMDHDDAGREGYEDGSDRDKETTERESCEKNKMESNLLEESCNSLVNENQNQTIVSTCLKDELDKEAKTEENRGSFSAMKFYQCGFEGCGFAGLTSTDFREHTLNMHSGAKEFKCAHCGHKSYTDECHFRHIFCHAKNQSGLLFKCGNGCKYASNILKHFREHLEKAHSTLKSFVCSSCKEVFNSIDELIGHCEANKLQFVLCPYCTTRDPNRRIIMKHISTIHPGKPRQITVTAQLICQERELNSYIAPKPISPEPRPISPVPNNEDHKEKSPKPFSEDQPIKIERRESSDENEASKPHESQQDVEAFASMDTVGAIEEKQPVEKTGVKLGIGSLLRCSKCSYLAGSSSLLRRHRLQHIRPSDRSRPFCCTVCPSSSDSIVKFERHINLHEGHHEITIYMCELCNYQTNIREKIGNHLQKSHRGANWLQDFKTRLFQTTVNVYTCEICENIYKSKREYVAHVSRHKSGKLRGSNVDASIDKHHCDCCSFSCDDIHTFIQHTSIHLMVTKSSPSGEVKQKPRSEFTGPRKPYYIPPGNVFKDFVRCCECPFKTKTRLDLLRHVKSHPNLEPKMKKAIRKEANPQERSTRELIKFQFGKRKNGSENETNKRLRTMDSSSESDEDVDVESDFVVPRRKQVAVKSTSGASLKQSNMFFLGGDLLHKKLQPCFSKEEDEPMFQCIMCSDVFEDKYTLHKHILEHMNVSFYKCNYCEHGELENSAMVTHIQKTHRKPIQHSKVKLEDIEDEINRAIHSMKAKEYWGENESIPDEKPILNIPIISPPANQESDESASRQEAESTSVSSPIILKQPVLNEKPPPTPDKNKLPECIISFGNNFKCIVCNQQAVQSYILVRHAMTHCSRKRFLCPYCDEKKSHYKSDICKHIHMKHRGEEVRVIYDKTDVELDAQYIAPNLMQQIMDSPDENPTATSAEEEDIKVEIKSEADTKEMESNDRKGKKVVVGFRSVYKCLLCKLTFKGKGKIYKHMRETKCKRPIWRCSVCKTRKFKSDKEKVIKDHIKENHKLNGDAKPVLCALNGKIRKHTMPVTVLKQEQEIKKVQNTEELASEETVKEKESEEAIATVIKKGDSWKCSKCSYTTNARANCVRHTYTHALFKKFGCPVCSFRAKCSRNVKNHMQNCHPGERIRFKIYTETSNSPKKSCNPDEKKPKEKVIWTPPQPVSYQCQECGFMSERKSSLSKHINAKCFTPLKGCSECDFTSINEDNIAEHVKNAHKAAKVTDLPLSGKILTVFSNENENLPESTKKDDEETRKKKGRFHLRVKTLSKSPMSKPLSSEMKMWSEENEQQSMNCPVCNEHFYDLRAFRDHFVNQHKENKLLCGECEEYAAHLPSLLFRHARLFHSHTKVQDLKLKAISQKAIQEKGLDKRPCILYRCPKCGKISERGPLRKHMYTHYNYNPYQCNHCDMKCKMPKNIRVHLSKIHPDKDTTEFTFRKNEKVEKEITNLLDLNRYQTLTRKTKMNTSMSKKGESTSSQPIPKLKIKKEVLENQEEDMEEEEGDEEGEEEESSEEEDEPRGDLKHMFSPCHNYKVEFDNRRQKTIYKCSICPYQSTVNKTIVTHFYHHVPHVFKCPYCDFQCYPRSKIANHIVKLHPGKSVHVVDLRQRMGNFKFRNYEKIASVAKTRMKEQTKQLKMKSDKSSQSIKEAHATNSRKRKERDEDSGGAGKFKDTGKLMYNCNFCDHRASGLYHYRQHLATHDGFMHLVPGTQIESRLKCGYCSYLAVDDEDFNAHVDYHFATRPFSCPYCTFSQYTASAITNHIKRSHPGKEIDVVKESDSSCLNSQEMETKAMLVNMEPKVKLTDIFAMNPEEFEKLLNDFSVCVIDLNYIPDEKFHAVSKTLGLENEENDEENAPLAKRMKKEPECDEDNGNAKLDESGDLETMIASGEIKIEENQKYDDVSDCELDVPDDISYEDLSDD
ncbi:uncharacterized protein LOC134249737 [Saccostrea cucullata]|uniref:uncharacterized protein LOC134249737 n=1 Tax=Saccostrea cuccullata TaxID=36930 RepID=UPI002ED2D38A